MTNRATRFLIPEILRFANDRRKKTQVSAKRTSLGFVAKAALLLASLAAAPVAQAQNAAAADLPRSIVWSVDHSTVTAYWAPANNAANILRYRIRWTLPGTGSWLNPGTNTGLAVPGGGAATGIRVTGLVPNKGYDFEIGSDKMVSGAVVTRWSGVALRVNTGLGAPPKVSGVHLKPSNGAIEVNWLSGFVSSATQQQPTGYAVRWARGAGSTDWINPGGEFGFRVPASAGIAIANRRDHNITGLTNGQTYVVQVAGYNRRGVGEWSDALETAPYTNPAAPVITVEPRQNKVSLKWTLADNGGSPIVGVVYRWRWTAGAGLGSLDMDWHSNAGGSDGTFVRIQGGNSLTITGINANHTTLYQLRVVNARNLQSDWSNAVQSSAGSRGQSQAKPGTPTLQFAQQRGGKVMFHFTPPNPKPALEVLGYEFRVWQPKMGIEVNGRYLNGGARATLSADGRSVREAHSFLVTQLPTGRATDTQLRAFNEAGKGEWSDSLNTSARDRTVAPEGGPPRITSFTATHNTMTVRWFPPKYDGGSTIWQYQWQLSNDADADWEFSGDYDIPGVSRGEEWAAFTGSPFVFDNSTATGLTITPGTEYTVRIRARNSTGYSSWSANAKVTAPQPPTPAPPVPAPGVVNSFTATNATPSDHNIRMAWQPPANAAEAQISHYLLRWKRQGFFPEWLNEGGADGVRVDSARNAYTTEAGADLPYGRRYRLDIAVVGANGRSNWVTTEVFLEAPPDAPQDVSLTRVSATRIDVHWTRPDFNGSNFLRYRVQRQRSGSAGWTTAHTTSGRPDTTSHILSGLQANVQYNVRVTVIYGAAIPGTEGPYSETSGETTSNSAHSAPPLPRFLSVTQAEGRKLKVDWQAPERTNGRALSGYRLRWSDDDDVKNGSDNTWEGPGGADGIVATSRQATEYLLGPLTVGAEYEVQIAAEQGPGGGAAGAFSEWTTSVSATPRRSAETALIGLRLSDGRISPGFDSELSAYAASVDNHVERLRITATAKDEFASFTIGKSGGQRWVGRDNTPSREFPLAVGENVFDVIITADNGEDTQTYRVTITRAALPLLTQVQAPVRFHADGALQSEVVLPRAYGAIGRASHLLTGVPTYLAYNAATRTLSTDPAEPPMVTETEEVSMVYTVRDSARPPREVTQPVSLTLAPPPIFSEAAPAKMTLTINTAVSVEFPALEGGFEPYTYVLEGELPDGLEFDTETRMLTGTPAAAEVKSLNYRGFDLLGARGTASGALQADVEVSVDTALPQQVEGLAANPADRRLRLSWTALERLDLANYRARWRTAAANGADGIAGTADDVAAGAWNGADDNGVSTGSFTETNYTVTGLTNNTAYDVQIAAENNLGPGEWSAEVTATPSEVLAFAATQEDLVVALDVPIRPRVTLPAAEHGEGDVAYTLTADSTGLAGLNFDGSTREIHGTITDNSGGTLVFPLNVATTYVATDSAATPVTDQLEFTIRIVAFDLDLDAAHNDAEAVATAQDGIITARYLLGVRGASLLQGQSGGDVTTHEATLKEGMDSNALDVDGDGDSDGDDGILIARYLLGLRGDELFGGFLTGADERTAAMTHLEALTP